MRKGIYKAPNGTWYIKVKRNGVYITKRGFYSKHDADMNYDDVVSQALYEKKVKTGLSIESIWNDYVEKRRLTCSAGTLVCDRSNYNYFKNLELNKYSILTFYKGLINDKKISNHKKNQIISTLKAVLKNAYYNKKISAELYQDLDVALVLPKYEKPIITSKEREAWTQEEIDKFFNAIPKDTYDYVLFRVFFELGCRIGELLGLQVQDYDRNSRKIAILRQRIHINGQGYVNTPKLKTSASYRLILISQDLSNLLNDYIDETFKKPTDQLFPTHRNTLRRKLYAYEDKAKIGHHVPHSIRHTTAVNYAKAISNFHELEIASKRLGHSPQIFMQTYANHVNDQDEERLLEKVGSGSKSGSAFLEMKKE